MENESTKANTVQTTFLQKWITNEVKFILLVGGMIWAFAGVYYPIKQDIALIRSNDLAHIEAFEKEQTRLSEIQTKQQEEIIALMTAVAKISN